MTKHPKEIVSNRRPVVKPVQSFDRSARVLNSRQARSDQFIPTFLGGVPPKVPAAAGVGNPIMKAKSKSERRLKKLPGAVRDATTASPSIRSFPVITMAASAGGLKALSVILSGLPVDFPAAITIVMHLAPDHKSLLAEILKCRTRLMVKQAQTGDTLCQSCVFVASREVIGKKTAIKVELFFTVLSSDPEPCS